MFSLAFFLGTFFVRLSTGEESGEAWGWQNSGRRRPDDAASRQKLEKHLISHVKQKQKNSTTGRIDEPEQERSGCRFRGPNSVFYFDRTFRCSTAFVSSRTEGLWHVALTAHVFSRYMRKVGRNRSLKHGRLTPQPGPSPQTSETLEPLLSVSRGNVWFLIMF